jgi:prepilin-type N-terminal cleavage/methylation domain-containing protein
MRRNHIQSQSGFTLIEVIVTIAVGAALACLLIQFTGSGLIKSAETVQQVDEDFSANDIMEQITADYRVWLATGATDLALFETDVLNNHAGSIVAGETGMVTLKSGEDAANSILQITIAQDDFMLSTLFTR